MHNKYDVIIIGAGIGGLVCGCYLAKAGMKVLIIEKNNKAGGYCTSLERDGFKYNLGITSFGNYGEKSRFRLIFEELGIGNKINFKQIDPANIIITPDFKIMFGNNIDYIKEQLQSIFPDEDKRINNFFDYIIKSTIIQLYVDLRNKTFSEFLDRSFNNDKLKSILCVFLGSLGLPAKEAAALSVVIIFREFIIKGGNFLKNEFVDKIPSLLADVFLKNGGELLLSRKVTTISVANNIVKNINIGNAIVKSDIVISNCDPLYTYKNLISKTYNVDSLKSLHVSNSAFVLYMTIKKNAVNSIEQPNVWAFSNYDIQTDIPSVLNDDKSFFQQNSFFMGIQSRYNRTAYPDKCEGVFVIINTKFKNKLFWKREGYKLKEILIKKLKENLNLNTSDILTTSYVTPIDLSEITNNLKGTMRGWASIIKQNSAAIFPTKSLIDNLYFTGQWVTNNYVQGGIVLTAANGRELANFLIKNYKKRIQ